MVFFLIGYMGSGKSTIGRALAKSTGFRFIDMDKEIERRCGKSIGEIFAAEGEEYFRRCEADFIAGQNEVQSDGSLVVATGGGAPCFGDNMQKMNATGTTIYLRMSPRRLAERLRHGRDKRPLIRNMDDGQLLEFVEKNLAARAPFYEQASMTIDCDGVSDDYICGHIERMIICNS